jgi:hypothetical protein
MTSEALTSQITTEFKTGDYVESHYHGARYTGVLGEINTKWKFAQLRMSPGVDMILPLSTMARIEEEEFDELDS